MAQNRDTGNARVDPVDEFEDYSYRRFKIRRAIIRYSLADGRMSAPVDRLCFERGHAVGLLLYDKTDDSVILVRQFRYPVYVSLTAEQRGGEVERAWVLEIIAGMQEKGEAPEAVARREAKEEAGYTVSAPLELVADVYPSPGGTSERITIYSAEVDRSVPVSGGGGVDDGEDTEVVRLPFEQAMAMIKTGEIADAKTVIALQHLRLRRFETTDEHG